MAIAIVVDWYGRFKSVEEARIWARKEKFGSALYMALGKQKRQRKSQLQYVGVATRIENRLTNGRFEEITKDLNVWVGQVSSHKLPGRRAGKRSTGIKLAEWGHAFFLALPLNKRLRANEPPSNFTLLNRWHDLSGSVRVKRPHKSWPDIIDFDRADDGANLAWIAAGGRVKRLSEGDIVSLRKPAK